MATCVRDYVYYVGYYRYYYIVHYRDYYVGVLQVQVQIQAYVQA